MLLLRTALDNIDRIPSLPVGVSVMHLFCRDFKWYADPAHVEASMLSCERSGLLRQAACRDAKPLSRWTEQVGDFRHSKELAVESVATRSSSHTEFIFSGLKGFKPLFVGHVGTGRRWRCLSERDAHLALYREALALEKQPQIRGIVAASWLHSRETHRVSPHLAFMNCAAGSSSLCIPEEPPRRRTVSWKADTHRAELYHTGQVPSRQSDSLHARANTRWNGCAAIVTSERHTDPQRI